MHNFKYANSLGFHTLFLGLALSLGFLLAFLQPAYAAPRTPGNDAEVVATLPFRANDNRARELAAMRAAVAKDDKNVDLSANLAQRYFESALSSGDPRYVGYAEAVVARFTGDLPPALLTLRGQLRQYRHEFAGALADFARAISIDPDLGTAHAWRGAIFLVQANYAAARTECDALATINRKVLASGCQGLTLAYTGQLQAAEATLQKAFALTKDPDQQLWLLTRLGEVAAWRGNQAQAQTHYQAALKLGLDDSYLLAAWTDFLLDNRREQDVLALLKTWEASDGLLLRLALAQNRLKLPDVKRTSQMLEDRFAAARARKDTTHQAEEARFWLDLRNDPTTALRVAAENFEVQREPRDARIVLEAALAAKNKAAAEPALAWLKSSGFEDAHLRSLAQQLAQGVAK